MATNGGNKLLNWALGALASIASYVAWVQKARVEDAKEREIKSEIALLKKDAQIDRLRKENDSLHSVILIRADKNLEDLKNILDINGKNATIRIKPKENDYEVQKHSNSRAVRHDH